MQVSNMFHPHTPFPRSLAVSVAIHALIFGTALSFAHYGENIFGGDSHIITVALVYENGRTASGAVRPAYRKAAAAQLPPAMSASDPEQGRAAVSPDAGNADDTGRKTGESSRSSEEPPGATAGAGPGGPAGLLSSEQWTVIVSFIERVKSYPRLARERGIEGVVLVRFRLRSSGEVDRVEIVKSSGYDILDSASVRTIYRAGPMPYVNGWVEVPISYVLK